MGRCNHRVGAIRPAGLLPVLMLLLLGLMMPVAAAQTAAPVLTIGLRVAPPYVIAATDGRLSGLEYELVMAAAQAGNLAVRPDIEPFGRLPEDFRRNRLDAFAPAGAAMKLPGCLSDTVLVYQNVAFTLARDRLPIDDVHDLAYYDVMAFQNASRLLGPAMRQVQKLNTRYHEVANQMLQVRALLSGRTDVVVADRRIFRFLMHSPDAGVDSAVPVTEHKLFPPNNYGVAFRDAGACAAFNEGLRRIRADGRYVAILEKWESALQAAGVSPTGFRRG